MPPANFCKTLKFPHEPAPFETGGGGTMCGTGWAADAAGKEGRGELSGGCSGGGEKEKGQEERKEKGERRKERGERREKETPPQARWWPNEAKRHAAAEHDNGDDVRGCSKFVQRVRSSSRTREDKRRLAAGAKAAEQGSEHTGCAE
ncbi:hypothetical protein Droror1_Dr00012128 [Drosera rotundifolia]